MMSGRVAPVLMMASGVGMSMFLFRRWANNGKEKAVMCDCFPRVANKVVVITGATSGIGYQVALECAKRQAIVIFGARNMKRGDEVACELKIKSNNMNITALHLDLNDLASCRKFSEEVLNRTQEISFLVNNAGVFNEAPELTKDGFDRTWQTNYLGCVVVTENLLDSIGIGLKGNRAIIFLSSEARNAVMEADVMNTEQMKSVPTISSFQDSINHYGRTKKALWMYATFLALCQGSLINYTVVSVDPGNVWTNIYRNSFRGSMSGMFTRLQCSMFMRSPLQGAQTVMHCILAPDITNGVCMKDCSVIERPQGDVIEYSPSFVANTHKLVARFIPTQSTQAFPSSSGGGGNSRRHGAVRFDPMAQTAAAY